MAEAEDQSFCVSSLLDCIPIIGTVKNTIETVEALCEKDYKKAEEKGISATLGLITDLIPEGLVIKGIEKEVVNVLGKAIAKKEAIRLEESAANAEARALARTATKLLNKEKTRQPESETQNEPEAKRSQRGEHVINNNVLRVYKDIREGFCDSVLHRIPEDLSHPEPFSPGIKRAIGSEMVAHFKEDEPYIDANATVYGINIRILRDNVIGYMKVIYLQQDQAIPHYDRVIERDVLEITIKRLYVDEKALAKWLREGGQREIFDQAQNEVNNMFRNLINGEMAADWVHELKRN